MSRLDLTNVSGKRCSQSCMFNPLALRPPFSDRPWDVTACLRASTTSGSILECLVPHCSQSLGQPAHSQSHLTQLGVITWVRFAASWIFAEGFLQPMLADRRRVTWDPSVSCFRTHILSAAKRAHDVSTPFSGQPVPMAYLF